MTVLDRDIQKHARDALQSADLVLLLSAPDVTVPSELAPDRPTLRVSAKSDVPWPDRPAGQLAVSAATGENISLLKMLIAERLANRAVSLSGQTLALQGRHESALRSAACNLKSAKELLWRGGSTDAIESPELVAHHLRAALDDLAGLGGKMTPEDVLARIFATFCIGK
jgi:tRNA modification GTPase